MKARRMMLLAGLLVAGAILRAAPLTIATYNVENYTLANRVVEGAYREGYPKPEAAKAALRTVISQINADVLALQEIGGRDYLDELCRDLKTDGVDYPYSAVAVAADKDRMVAVISKRPLTRIVAHTDLDFKYFGGRETVRRGLLQVAVETDHGAVTLFVVHLKSRYTERPDDAGAALWRAGEAVAIRDRVLELFPEPRTAAFVIAGDFNDDRTSRPVRAMLERGKTAITEWLPAADSRGEVWSHFYQRGDSYSRVDHMLVSPALLPRVKRGEGHIHDSVETMRASDHRPVVVVVD
jgi:endonuclease/exonuclease/phosphatase family metal-dependent hydrolase